MKCAQENNETKTGQRSGNLSGGRTATAQIVSIVTPKPVAAVYKIHNTLTVIHWSTPF